MLRILSTCDSTFDPGCARCALTAVALLGAEPAGFNTSDMPAAVGILAI